MSKPQPFPCTKRKQRGYKPRRAVKKRRHSGRDCRNPEAMEGNSSLSKCLILVISSPQFNLPVYWIPAIPAGMTYPQHLCITARSGVWERA